MIEFFAGALVFGAGILIGAAITLASKKEGG